MKAYLLDRVKEVCGITNGDRIRYKETWWWNRTINSFIKEKQKLWKELKNGGIEENCLNVKKIYGMQSTEQNVMDKQAISTKSTPTTTEIESSR